ncbi:DMT family transporter [Corallincola luteus]|uniref:DMT family transporter n=1 Tax=Corallincola luteus TaxID=1775177 RepID=A0ABY2ARB1_9GAMM|nr:DMT family transporter [Corallincola luteus]TCI05138.1 DMT family transporter [Corallincola luteus]
MSTASFLRLILLAALWGASFLFLRVAAPVMGSVALITSRVALAALLLAAVAVWLKKAPKVGLHWRHYLVLGLVNSAIPWVLLAYAAHTLSASVMSILNATAPMWGMVCVAVVDRQGVSAKRLFGLFLGTIGVAMLVGLDPTLFGQASAADSSAMWFAVGAMLTGTLCYGIASTYTRSVKGVDAFNNAHGSMWAATLLLAPLLLFYPVQSQPTTLVLSSVVVLGIACTGIALLIYFKLVADEGAPSALTVTYLIPMFGVLWGHLFLDEQLGWHTLLGSCVVLMGTALVTGFSPMKLFNQHSR